MTISCPRIALTVALSLALVLGSIVVADAGCGCSKLPPDLASVRPHATYAGTNVSLFHPAIQPGASYDVAFASGTTSAAATVQGVGVLGRDLADGVEKPQIVVPLPVIALGPAAISITLAGDDAPILELDDALFTVVPDPVALPEWVGGAAFPTFQAAVSRSGAVYFSLDVSDVSQPRVFDAQLQGYPLRFGSQDVVFYNTQGFLMQRLDEGMPGLFSIESATAAVNSDILHYSRHEFSTFLLQHAERQPHAIDPTDANWHVGGSPHIDHDHLIVAILGTVDGATPAAGATQAFTIALESRTLFDNGLVGEDAVWVDGYTGSYHSSNGTVGAEGDVASNGLIVVGRDGTIDGNATAAAFDISGTVTGQTIVATAPLSFLRLDAPAALEDLGPIAVSPGQTLTLTRGSYRLSALSVANRGELVIDNSEGPVTLYVSGDVYLHGAVTVADPDPENFALYVEGSEGAVTIKSNGSFSGLLYAPDSEVTLQGSGSFRGAFVGSNVALGKRSTVLYDSALRGSEELISAFAGTTDGSSRAAGASRSWTWSIY